MEVEIIGSSGTEWTDNPRALTQNEIDQIAKVGRLEGIKLHRTFTQSTLAAAVREVNLVLRNN